MTSRDFESNWTSSGRDNGDFNRLSEQVSANVTRISQNVGQVQRLIGQISTQQDSEQNREKLHGIQHSTNLLAKETSKVLQDLNNLPSPDNPNEQRQRKLQRERLMNDFSVVLNNFQSAQRSAASKEKASVNRARANSSNQANDNPFFDDDNTSAPAVAVPPPRESPMQSQMERDVNLQAIKERELAIKNLESDIVDVNQIFKDLALMVHDQGEIVDSIESNVESAQINVESAHRDLQKAHQSKQTYRKRKLICGAVLIVLLIVIAVIIYVSVKNN